MSRRRVFITGTGVLCSLGTNPKDMYLGLKAMKSGVRAFPEWAGLKGLHSLVAGEVPPFDAKSVIDRKARRTMSRMSEMVVLAALQALQEAGMTAKDFSGFRSLAILGSTDGSPATMETYFRQFFERGGPEGQLSGPFFKTMNHSVAANLSIALDLYTSVLSCASACSTSSQSMVLGWELIQSGLYDRVIAGGADELSAHGAAVFDTVLAASRKYNDRPTATPRPFDIDRDGLAISEGAGLVVMESEDAMLARGGKPIVEFLGGAYLADGSHIAQPTIEGMQDTMKEALERAKVSTSELDYVNAHATGTHLGDVYEARAISGVVGNSIPVSSLKGHLGHALAACGAIETIASIGMMKAQEVIGTRNLEIVDPECGSANLIRHCESVRVEKVLKNNFAFGGVNTSLVLSSARQYLVG